MNRLKNEKSPYLLQHADNPVDWMPWGGEAFMRAKKENKPVFLSIGYSTCHWCHVMEKESFEDTVIASLLNRVFVCIKVDREERPDIDKIYMSIAQMITGSGGWPLSIFMTPDKKPFFAATYIPKEDRFNQIGLKTLIPRIERLWKDKNDEILASASTIVGKLGSIKEDPAVNLAGPEVLDGSFKAFQNIFDREYGGFGSAPKFPSTHNLSFLLRYWKKTGNPEALEMVTKTLDQMAYGGIWDHIGHGFHRYSTDRQWKVPHFEKMLYDQASISMAYIEAYQATKKHLYREVSEKIFQYVLDDMTSEKGGFFSAEDADSEGVEGKYYLWTDKELKDALEDSQYSMAASIYNISREGNFKDEATGEKTGDNILYKTDSNEKLAKHSGIDTGRFKDRISVILDNLKSIRKNRTRPLRDEKILTDWNGFMISSLARGGTIFEKKEYIDAAVKAAGFIFNNLSGENGRLFHSYSKGCASIDANLDDYSFMIMALIELYQATFDYKYIKMTEPLNTVLDDYFWDNDSGGYYFTPVDKNDLILRQKESYDGAIPSGNSIAVMNLLRLGKIKMDKALEEKAVKALKAFSRSINGNPVSHTQFLAGLDFLQGDSYEIIIAKGEKDGSLKKMLKVINSHFIPNKVIVLSDGNQDIPDFMKDLEAKAGKTTAYICKNYYCKLPVTSGPEMLGLLDIENK